MQERHPFAEDFIVRQWMRGKCEPRKSALLRPVPTGGMYRGINIRSGDFPDFFQLSQPALFGGLLLIRD
jgi:hypothetical protein